MLTYLSKRLLLLIPTFIGITIIAFFIIHLAPGKPTDIMSELNPKITPEARAKLEAYYGLDKPIIVQYGSWVKKLIGLDLGDSFSSDRRPVWDKIKERLPITITINVLAMVIIFSVAVPIGISSATRQYSLYDKVTSVLVFLGFATPAFWLALLLMMLFGVKLG
jgi:peptide/nickel transport system permease protein